MANIVQEYGDKQKTSREEITMKPGREEIAEFRFYEMPVGRYDLALLGEENWKITYRAGELHFHNFFEIGYCYSGEGEVYLEDERPQYTGGIISLIPANFAHAADSKEHQVCFWEWLYIDLSGFLDACYKEEPHRKQKVLEQITRMPILISVEEYPQLAAIIRGILEENRKFRSFSKDVINGYLYIFVQELLRLNEHMFPKKTRWNMDIGKVRRALLYVDEHYSEKINVEDLAAQCHISEPYFRKLFAECMKVSPVEYLNIIRIQKACGFLHREDISIQTLAWKVGYMSVSAFERNFKKITGETPKQWKLHGIREDEYINFRSNVLKGWIE